MSEKCLVLAMVSFNFTFKQYCDLFNHGESQVYSDALNHINHGKPHPLRNSFIGQRKKIWPKSKITCLWNYLFFKTAIIDRGSPFPEDHFSWGHYFSPPRKFSDSKTNWLIHVIESLIHKGCTHLKMALKALFFAIYFHENS